MTTFWIICAAILLIALLFVVIPLWRGTSRNNAVERDAANLEILRDQIAEMDNDLKNGLLTPELHAQGKRELEARLLDEVGELQGEAGCKPHPFKKIAIALTILLPLLSVGLYYQVGSPEAFLLTGQEGGMPHDGATLQLLEARVAKNPQDADALFMLGRTYGMLGRFADSARAYGELVKLVPGEVVVWADYADALGMASGSLLGEPTKALERAMQIDPNQPKVLWLSASAAMERGDIRNAVAYLEKLEKLVPPQSEDGKTVAEQLSAARQILAKTKSGRGRLEKINEPVKTAAGKSSLSGTVEISAALKAKASPDDTLFVLARAVNGPPMPLAAIRKQVKDLPLQFTLDESMAMSQEMSLSHFDQVVVVARISKSGDAISKPGDLQGISSSVSPGSKGIKVVIDQTVR